MGSFQSTEDTGGKYVGEWISSKEVEKRTKESLVVIFNCFSCLEQICGFGLRRLMGWWMGSLGSSTTGCLLLVSFYRFH